MSREAPTPSPQRREDAEGLLRGVSEPAPLTAATADRILQNVYARRRAPRKVSLKTISVLVLGGSLAFAGVQRVLFRETGGPVPPEHPHEARMHPMEPEKAAASTVESEHGKASPPLAARAPERTGALSPDALSLESSLLARALNQLRQQRSPEGALATLNLYRQRFPRGQLRGEASFARVEALVALERFDAALELVGALQAQRGGPARRQLELAVLKGELLLRQGRPAEALVAFEAVTTDDGGALEERALYGTWSAYMGLGRTEPAKDVARRYLEQFPSGRFSDAMKSR